MCAQRRHRSVCVLWIAKDSRNLQTDSEDHYKNTPTNILKILRSKKNANFQIKNSDIFHISALNIDSGYSLGSSEYPQFFLLSRNKKKNVLPCKSHFYFIKVVFKRVKTI